MDARAILRNGLIDRNPGFVQMLGLCPLLAVSTSVASALGLGLATIAVLLTSNAIAALAGPRVPREVRLAVFVLMIAAAVTSVELAMAAWLPGLHAALGIFLPLIVTNCLVLARADAFASRQPVGSALLDGFAMGGGFLVVLVALGSVREVLGRGSLGGDLHLLLGIETSTHGLHLFSEQHGFLLALLPPGAFILLGLGLAWRQARRAGAPASTMSTTVIGSKTGGITS